MLLETILQDVRIGARVLAREKGFCALAVTAVALGIGAVTTELAVVNGAFIRGLAFPHAERLVDVRLIDPASIYPKPSDYVTTVADFEELKAAQTSFDGFVAYVGGATVSATYHSRAQHLEGGFVSHDFFRTLGVAPALGRDFLPEDDRPAITKAVILSDALWKSDFGGDPRVLGQSLRVNGGAATIIGVMPPDFAFPRKDQLWIPINTQFAARPQGESGAVEPKIVARLKPSVTTEQADAEIAAIARRLAAQYPGKRVAGVGGVYPLVRVLVSPSLAHQIWSMLAFSVGVLLIAAVNVMNMQFARASLRVKELAIRSALGATRIRLVRQMLTESLLFAFLGSIAGVALAVWATAGLDHTLHSFRYPLPVWLRVTIDGPVLALVVGLTGLAAVLTGLVPALAASRTEVMTLLKESGRGSTGAYVKAVARALVVFQVAASCVLLIGSLIESQSIARGQHVDYGYDTGGILSGNLDLMEIHYPTNESRVAFNENLLRLLRETAGVESAALTSRYQMVFAGWGERIEIDGRVYRSDADRPVTQLEKISDGYWAITGQRLVAGRDFAREDNDIRQPVAIVNESFARKHFGRDSPLGHRFRLVRNDGQLADRWRTIVGVISDVLMLVPANVKNDNAGFYLPFNAAVFSDGPPVIAAPQYATVILKPRGGARPEALVESLRAAVARLDPDLPVSYLGTPQENLAIAFSLDRAAAGVFTAFSGIAMLLAAIGIYGTVSFSVNQRTQEFGIRMALGAERRHLLAMVLREGAWQLGTGLALGLATAVIISFAAADWIDSFRLYHIGPRDPATYATVGLMFAVVSLVATLVPARRAARVDPVVALRAE